ncbi:trypsin-like serine protease [Litorivicinus lipolyticus]|uniref:Trypsin-like serine protease n=1 Tax=Litorivicinus lipolyticus TaxID=418701 RepID=A0A5Q2QBV5_9GAMM|nr:serine protease [Litorivicinus lipolyticus]QGG80584.1 trypsin-like serine protease [Litorivicinus lipolyticus]
MPLTQSYQKVKNSVVQVLALNGANPVSFGSGTIIGDGRHVLTCAHCIVAGARMSIADPNQAGRALYGAPVFSDHNLDIALIEFPNPVGPAVAFGDSTTCATGNGAFVVGYPMGINEQVLLSAHIASVTPTHLRIDASVNHGNSGGPLFNLAGEQIGVVNAKHGSLSAFLTQVMNARPGAQVVVDGIDPVHTIQALIAEMQKNLNLGIGYAVPSASIKQLHAALGASIP